MAHNITITISLDDLTTILSTFFVERDEIMEELQGLRDAIRINHEEALAAMDRVAADVAALEAKIDELDNDEEELAEIKAALVGLKTDVDTTSAALRGLDPVADEAPEEPIP